MRYYTVHQVTMTKVLGSGFWVLGSGNNAEF